MLDYLQQLKSAKIRLNINYVRIPVTVLDINDDNASTFNKLVEWVEEQEFNRIVRTPSGGISIKVGNLRLPAWDIRKLNSCIELTLLIKQGMYRIQFRTSLDHTDNGKQLYGRQAFRKFRDVCEKYGIELDDYIIDNGPEVKKEIESPMVKLARESFRDMIFKNTVHHIDFHSSYGGGLAITHPEFNPVIDEIYDGRKVNPENKSVLTNSIGFMQSLGCCNAKWGILARDAINNNNERIRIMAQRLTESGRLVLLYNTDGIWYSGELYELDDLFGDRPGQWSHDYTYCKQFRAKGNGAYEFIDSNGNYVPKLRGKTKLDLVKDRSEWSWGDIYHTDAVALTYQFIGNRICKDGLVL